MIAHDAAKYYLSQPNTYSIVDVREKFGGDLLVVEGKPHIVFPDESSFSVQKVVQAKFDPKGGEKHA